MSTGTIVALVAFEVASALVAIGVGYLVIRRQGDQ